MLILATSTEFISIPVASPLTNLTSYPVSIALIVPGVGEPGNTDYKTATWINGEASMLITAGDYPAGEYLAYVRVQASPEDVRLLAGRVRIGDARS